MGIKKQQIESKDNHIKNKIFTIIGTVLSVILIPILIINVTLIIKSYTNTDDVPSIGGYCPLIVLTDSMYPEIQSGDLVICHSADANEIVIGDIISFFDPDGNGMSVVTHRVINIVNEKGKISFQTKGDANNTEDNALVPAENLVGVYKMKISGAGNVAMFMQSTSGLIVCVVIPLLLLVGYDVLRRRHYEKIKKQDTDALLAELEMLKAEKAAINVKKEDQ